MSRSARRTGPRSPRRRAVATLALTSGLCFCAQAHAADPLPDTLEGGGHGDGVYGRFDGPFALALGASLEAAPTSGALRPGAAGALRFYQTAGIGVGYSQAVMTEDPLERSLGVSFLLEPLFLVRWSRDGQWGRAFWDLLVDSLSLSGGVLLAEPRGGTFGDAAAFRGGLGLGLPLLARASGPWLRLGGQLDVGLEPDVVGTLQVRLEWQWVLRTRPHD